MKRFIVIFCTVLSLMIPEVLQSQDTTSQTQILARDLPATSLKSKYRVQIMESPADQLEMMQKAALEYTGRYHQNTYITRKNGIIQLHAGDFAEKGFAKQKQSFLKKNYKKSRVVKADNDSLIGFFRYEKKKPVNKPKPAAVPEKPSTENTAQVDEIGRAHV